MARNRSTEVPHQSRGKNWEEYMFDNMPVAAAVTLLAKVQSDVRDADFLRVLWHERRSPWCRI